MAKMIHFRRFTRLPTALSNLSASGRLPKFS